MELVSSFPERLNEAMNGMSQSDLAIKLGVSKQTVSAYINGTRKPKKPMIETICRKLNVNPAWLLGFNIKKQLDEVIEENKLFALSTIEKEIILKLRHSLGVCRIDEAQRTDILLDIQLLDFFNQLNDAGIEAALSSVGGLTQNSKLIKSEQQKETLA